MSFFFQDTVASLYKRNNLLEIVKKTAEKVMIPITVCGGVRSIEDVRELLRAGADKVAINTAAIKSPILLNNASKTFGSQCIVSSIEAKKIDNGKYEAWVDYGRQPTGLDVMEWSKKVVDLGVGEIFLSTIDNDGSGHGFDIELINEISSALPIPVIACSGAGIKEHFKEVIGQGKADAVSAASIFHYHYAKKQEGPFMSYNKKDLRLGKQIDSGNIEFLNYGYGDFQEIQVNPCSIPELKEYLNNNKISIRKINY